MDAILSKRTSSFEDRLLKPLNGSVHSALCGTCVAASEFLQYERWPIEVFCATLIRNLTRRLKIAIPLIWNVITAYLKVLELI